MGLLLKLSPFFSSLPRFSRFQARNIEPLALDGAVEALSQSFPSLPLQLVTQLATFGETVRLLESSSISLQAGNNATSTGTGTAVGSSAKLPHFPLD